MRGRRYRVLIEITYAGGRFPDETREALDDALMTTGLFEQFDVTGKVLRVAPLDQAERISQEPAGPATAGPC